MSDKNASPAPEEIEAAKTEAKEDEVQDTEAQESEAQEVQAQEIQAKDVQTKDVEDTSSMDKETVVDPSPADTDTPPPGPTEAKQPSGPDVKQTALAVRDTGRSVASTLALGLKVLASEYKWLGLKGMRAFEIRQMKRRLDQEYTVLGRALSKILTDPEAKKASFPIDEDTRLILRQISFLRDEISLLEEEREQLREHFVARRKEAWKK